MSYHLRYVCWLDHPCFHCIRPTQFHHADLKPAGQRDWRGARRPAPAATLAAAPPDTCSAEASTAADRHATPPCRSPAGEAPPALLLGSPTRVDCPEFGTAAPSIQIAKLQRRPLLAARASGDGSGGGSGPGSSGSPAAGGKALQQAVASPLYRIWLQLGVVLLLLMLVDAGFSGDWSRIGAITTEQEAALRQVGARNSGCVSGGCGARSCAVL